MLESFLLLLDRWNVAHSLIEPPVVEPVHPAQGGKLHVRKDFSGSVLSDGLGLAEVDHKLG